MRDKGTQDDILVSLSEIQLVLFTFLFVILLMTVGKGQYRGQREQ